MILIVIFSSCFLIGALLYFKRSPKTILIVLAVLLTALICFFCWAASEDENYVKSDPYRFSDVQGNTLALSDGRTKHQAAEKIIQRKTSISACSLEDRKECYNWVEKQDTWQMSL